MTLREHLAKHRTALLKQWFDRIAETYPSDMAAILKTKQGFTNPVGQTISLGVEDILDALLAGNDLAELAPFLDNIIRVRAVQDFRPSQAVSFIFLLKQVIRKELSKPIREQGLHNELAEIDAALDQLSLMAFDIFMQCREQLYNIKANELRDRTLWLLKRANFITETPDDTPAEHGDRNINQTTKEVT
jgi:hypothetical protein